MIIKIPGNNPVQIYSGSHNFVNIPGKGAIEVFSSGGYVGTAMQYENDDVMLYENGDVMIYE